MTVTARQALRHFTYGIQLQGPVRVHTIRLDNCCNRGGDAAHCALKVEQQRLRPCLRLRFFDGI